MLYNYLYLISPKKGRLHPLHRDLLIPKPDKVWSIFFSFNIIACFLPQKQLKGRRPRSFVWAFVNNRAKVETIALWNLFVWTFCSRSYIRTYTRPPMEIWELTEAFTKEELFLTIWSRQFWLRPSSQRGSPYSTHSSGERWGSAEWAPAQQRSYGSECILIDKSIQTSEYLNINSGSNYLSQWAYPYLLNCWAMLTQFILR